MRGYFSGALLFSRELTLIRPWSSIFGAHLYLRYTEILIHPRLARYLIWRGVLVDSDGLRLTKIKARKTQIELRKQLALTGIQAAQGIVEFAKPILETCNLAAPTVSFYNAFGSELSLFLLAEQLQLLGVKLAMPVVVEKSAPLVFRHWSAGCEMAGDLYDISSPSEKNETLQPDIILLPLLGFDLAGGRLGYGGGFYDRTLEALRHASAIGVGFAGQEMKNVPMGLHDKRLGYILTENDFLAVKA